MSTDVNSPTGLQKPNLVNIMNLKLCEQEEPIISASSKPTQKQLQPQTPLKLDESMKNLHHPFDEVLSQTSGDVTVVMKIATN